MSDQPTPDTLAPIACTVSTGFADWLRTCGGSLLLSTYQAGRVAVVGWDGQQITMHLSHFPRPMGLALAYPKLAVAIQRRVLILHDAPAIARSFPHLGPHGVVVNEEPVGYDACFLPRMAYESGPLDVHDLAFGAEGLWLVATQFSCVAQLSPDYSFVPCWAPSFITALVPEDRCHLNGLALVAGQPRYLTALGETDTPFGWRANKAAGGLLLDMAENRVLLRGLAMPHSPRWHEERLWFLNSAAGELCYYEPQTNRYTVVALLPGFLRGLCFVGPYAVVGLCKLRASRTFGTLPLEFRFPELQCGVAVVDCRTGEIAAQLQFTSGCDELYDVQWLADHPRAVVLNDTQMSHVYPLTTPQQAFLMATPE